MFLVRKMIIFFKILIITVISNETKNDLTIHAIYCDTRFTENRDLKLDGCQSNLYDMVIQLLFFLGFTTSFAGDIL